MDKYRETLQVGAVCLVVALILFSVRFFAPPTPDIVGDQMRAAIESVRRLNQLPESAECSRMGSTSMSRMTCTFAIDIRRVGLDNIAAQLISEGWCHSDPIAGRTVVLARGKMALVLEQKEAEFAVSAFYYPNEPTKCSSAAH